MQNNQNSIDRDIAKLQEELKAQDEKVQRAERSLQAQEQNLAQKKIKIDQNTSRQWQIDYDIQKQLSKTLQTVV
jgi:hypothetical protein